MLEIPQEGAGAGNVNLVDVDQFNTTLMERSKSEKEGGADIEGKTLAVQWQELVGVGASQGLPDSKWRLMRRK